MIMEARGRRRRMPQAAIELAGPTIKIALRGHHGDHKIVLQGGGHVQHHLVGTVGEFVGGGGLLVDSFDVPVNTGEAGEIRGRCLDLLVPRPEARGVGCPIARPARPVATPVQSVLHPPPPNGNHVHNLLPRRLQRCAGLLHRGCRDPSGELILGQLRKAPEQDVHPALRGRDDGVRGGPPGVPGEDGAGELGLGRGGDGQGQ
mmetsp:Transcript_50664/g.115118  ORF Transcript_50664/g.115118 Transcript_50664/m.115118 type:complete len:203 (+) Transcript_50664:660-1268(+)